MIELDAGLPTPGQEAPSKKDDSPRRRKRVEGYSLPPHVLGVMQTAQTRSETAQQAMVDAGPSYVEIIQHLGKTYSAVFRDHTYQQIVEIWERRKGNKWKCMWCHLWKLNTLTQHLKNISAKALVQGAKTASASSTLTGTALHSAPCLPQSRTV